MSAIDHLNAGNLESAIADAKQLVRSNAADNASRELLAQLFCFAADWERADNQFDILGQQNADLMIGSKLLRQLVRAETARRQFYQEGRLPELADDVDDGTSAVLEALLLLREGQESDAAAKLAPLHERAETLTGTVNGTRFEGGRDLDDVACNFFEVLTSNGKFYWLPMDKVIRIDWREYERLQDRIWRSGTILVDGFNADGEVYFPVGYACHPNVWASADDGIKLGQKTDWYAASPEGPVRGMGQRLYLFGDREYSMMELESYHGPLSE